MTNNGFENYGFHNKIYLPDMTEEDIFLGGGSNSGSYNTQSLPNIKGNTGSMYRSDSGARDFLLLYNEHANNKNYTQGKGWEGAFSLSNRNASQIKGLNIVQGSQGKDFTTSDLIGISFNANLSNPIYKDGANVRPNYYNVDWYIKYK